MSQIHITHVPSKISDITVSRGLDRFPVHVMTSCLASGPYLSLIRKLLFTMLVIVVVHKYHSWVGLLLMGMGWPSTPWVLPSADRWICII